MGGGDISLKILYIPASIGFFHDPIDEAIVKTLEKLEVKVSVYDFVHNPDLKITTILEKELPNLVLTLHGNFLSRNIMKTIKDMGYQSAIWFVDDPYEIDNTVTYATWFTHVFTIEKSCIPIYQQAGIKSVHWLPLGTFPDYFHPINVENKYKSDICIVGTAFDKRIEIIDSLSDYLLTKKTLIIGRWWKRLKSYSKMKNHIINRLIPPGETARYFNGAKINLNIHRTADDRTAELNSKRIAAETPNVRTFDIAACQAFQITDFRTQLDKFFIPEQEIITFKNNNDLKDKIEYYLNHQEERKTIANLAREKTLNNNTMYHRLKKILTIVGS